MSHFPDEYWFDYVRGLLASDQIEAMKLHLEDCARCRDLHDVWQRVLDTVIRESRFVPDPGDVRAATAAFKVPGTESAPRRTILAAVVFDSFLDPAPAGVRSALAQVRHLLFEADNWTVAIRLKTESGNRVVLAGHVTRSGGSSAAGQNLEVTISDRQRIIAQTTTNVVGEFYLQYEDRSGLQLHVQLSDEHALEVDLPAPDR